MNIITKYVLNLLTSTALVVFVVALLFGWGDFVDQLGGFKSFVGLIAFLAVGTFVLWGINYLQGQDYTDRLTTRIVHLVIAAIVVVGLGLIGYSWVDLPNGTGMKMLVSVVACAIAAAIATVVGYVEDE